MRERDQEVYIYEEDLQLLPKEFYPVYKDTKDKLEFVD